MNQKRIQEHAERRLDDASSQTAQRIQSFREFLDIETDRLRARHQFGLGGKEIAERRSDLVDVVVGRACRMVADDLGPGARADLALASVIALGGYGRRELAPYSDVDLLFLHPDRLSSAVTHFVQGVLPLLWDIGLKVGHSVRSVPDCVAFGLEDLHARNAMADARLLVGSQDLFQRLEGDLFARVYRNTRANKRFFKAMRAEFEGRRQRYGPVVGMLEPHLKEGAGGLRDLHTVGWVGLAAYGARGLEGLVREGVVEPVEYGRTRRAYDFLLRVRNEAHFQTGRGTDLLTLDLQPRLATGLGYSDQDAATASEIFMRDFYFRAQEIQRFSDRFLRKAEFTTPPPGLLPLATRTRAVGPERRYRIRDGVLLPGPDGPDLANDPLRLFEVFAVAQHHGVRVGEELKEAVQDHLGLVDRRTRTSLEVATVFLSLLRPLGRVASTLREMHETGLLGRYLPEFRRVTLMAQHDHYHRYTVDEHTLQAVEGLDRLAAAEGGGDGVTDLRGALAELADPALLVLAVVLHDLGKGQGGGHVTRGGRLSARVAARMGMSPEAADDLVFLVSKHLVMSQVAQRRDLTDQVVLQGFAETVGSLDRLNMLYLLTYVDIQGVGPGTWNQWKGSLLAELYHKARVRITGGAPVDEEAERRIRMEEKVLEELDPEFLRSDVDEFLTHLPDRYLRSIPADLIARHFLMARELGTRTLVADWKGSPRAPYTTLSVCVRDAPGVLARLAGALTGSGLDILSVDVFTRDDGIGVDVFRVCESVGTGAPQPVDPERFTSIERELAGALEGRVDLELVVERQRARQVRRRRKRAPTTPMVRFEPPDPAGRTAIEVRADDEPGLVYRIAATLARLGVSISYAKIATEKNHALDIFYVRNQAGAPLSSPEQDQVSAALVDALAHAPGSRV